MSIEVRCDGCGRRYRVANEAAGKQVKCKACEAIITIPAAPVAVGAAVAPPRLPPPLPIGVTPPRVPATSYPPSGAPFQQMPYSRTGLTPQTPPSFWRTHRTLLIIAGGVLAFAVMLLGGYVGYRVVRSATAASAMVASPAASFNDGELQSKLAGTWSGTQKSANGPVSATLTFRANGTYDTRLITGGRVADLGGTYDIQNHVINLVITTIRTGDPTAVGKKIALGYIKQVTDTTLILGTQNGDETYQRHQPKNLALHPPTPPMPPTFPTPPTPRLPLANSPVAPSNSNPPEVQHPSFAGRQSSPTVTLPPSPTGVTEAGPWKDLLEDLDTSKSTVTGDWKISQGILTGSSSQGIARLKLQPPSATSFELELTFNRRSGTKEFSIVFPAGQHPAQLSMGGMSGQVSYIEGGSHVHSGVQIVNNTDQLLRLIVKPMGDDASIVVTLDGQPYLSFTGPQSRLRFNRMYATDDPNTFSLAVHQSSTVDFKHVRVRIIPAG